jgi:cell division protease FtsH
VNKISIIPRGVAALGYTQQLPTEDRYLMTRSELLARIYVLLGGRVAEEMIFGDISTGAQNDLQKATEIARTMVTQFGMSERLGLVALEGPRTPPFLPVPTPAQKEYSDETARMVDEEIKKLLNDAHVKVRDLLGVHRQALEELAKLLLEKEVVDRPELLAILKVRSIGSLKDKDKTQRREQPHMRDDRPT